MPYELPSCECVMGQSPNLSELLKNIYCAIYAGGGGGGLPDQAGHAGEFLTTDGTDASWVPLAGGGDVVASGTLTLNSLIIGQGGTTVAATTTGTGVVTALGVNVGSAGAFVVNGGAGGTPSSLTLTNATGLPAAGVALTSTRIPFGSAGNVQTSSANFTFTAASGTLVFGDGGTGAILQFGSGMSLISGGVGTITLKGDAGAADENLIFDFNAANTVSVTSGTGVTSLTFATIALSANNITANTAFLPDANDGAALGTTALQFSDLFLAEGGVINWDNGDATLTQAGNVLTLAGADFVADNVTVNTALLPDANDGAALGAAATSFADLFLAEGGVINWDNGDCTLTQSGNTLTVAGAEFIIDPASGPTSVSAGGFRGIPQNSQSAAYTTVLADAGKHIFHPAADNNARTFTIDSNANVPYPIGTAITFINLINTITLAITSDTLTFLPAGTTGSRTLAANNSATAVKVGTTQWVITGTSGLT